LPPPGKTLTCNAEFHKLNTVGKMKDPRARGPGLRLAIFEFLVPGHLDGFELAFVGKFGVAGEAGEVQDPFVEIGESDRERVEIREAVSELDADFFRVIPIECEWHFFLPPIR